MKRFLNIALGIVAWLAILAYLIFAARYCREQQRTEQLSDVEIVVTDYDRLQIVSPEAVRGWLAEAGITLEGSGIEDINTDRIMEVIGSRTFVKDVTAYTEQSGTLHISLSQRIPIARVARGDGSDFYISDDLWILPTKTGTAEYVPVITGSFGLPFDAEWFGKLQEPSEMEQKKLHQNYTFLLKLINFVRLTGNDPFWSAEIVQIDVRGKEGAPEWKEPDIEIIPRAGNHIIALGTTDNVEEKLAKLMLFYRNVLDYEGWDKYRLIDIRYDNQVVCRKQTR